MAFIKTSDSIIIKATLTDEGRKLLARGNFKIAKFALGDDEIDYGLYDSDGYATRPDSYKPALESIKLYEAYGNEHKNLQFGLNSFDSGVVYLTAEQLNDDDSHAHIMYLPILKANNKLGLSPSVTGSVSYLSVNSETTGMLKKISGLKFLETNRPNNCKIIIESGMMFPQESDGTINVESIEESVESAYDTYLPSRSSREYFILQKFLLDNEFYVFADNRLINGIKGISPDSKFENFAGGETVIKLMTGNDADPVSIESEFENYATYILRSIPNLLYDFATEAWPEGESFKHSSLNGPRGSLLACNPKIVQDMRTNSSTDRDFRFTEFGKIDQILFSELPSSKFDYIDTTIYFIGATTNSRVRVPIRIVRYSGT